MDKLFEIFPLFYYNVASFVIFFALLRGFRTSTERVKYRALYVMCLVNFFFYVINDYYYYIGGSHILSLLPLQLCNIAVFLIPAALLSKKRLILDFAFYLCVPGAFMALLIPTTDYIGITYSLMTVSFFVYHFMIAAIPFLMAGWGMYKPMPSIKKALSLSIFIFALGGAMHLLNLAFESFLNVGTNYFFTIIEFSAPSNPAFALLSKAIPIDFIYLLPALLIMYFYMGIVFVITRFKGRYIKTTIDNSRTM